MLAVFIRAIFPTPVSPISTTLWTNGFFRRIRDDPRINGGDKVWSADPLFWARCIVSKMWGGAVASWLSNLEVLGEKWCCKSFQFVRWLKSNTSTLASFALWISSSKKAPSDEIPRSMIRRLKSRCAVHVVTSRWSAGSEFLGVRLEDVKLPVPWNEGFTLQLAKALPNAQKGLATGNCPFLPVTTPIQ